MESWFPQLKQTKTAQPRLRVLTFPNAGSSENVYTGMDKTSFGSKSGRRENALMKWAKATKVEIYAAQPPGRDSRMKEPPLRSAKAIAEAVFEVLKKEDPAFFDDGTPFALFAHSMGTWCAYEFSKLAAPHVLIVSGFPGPSLPLERRPWTPQKNLPPTKEAFQAECREWNINEVIFADGMWKMYEGLLRADFECFDEYPVETQLSKKKFPIRAFYGSKDARCTADLVSTWSEVSQDFQLLEAITGHHLFPYDEPARAEWFAKAILELEKFQPPMLFECVAPKGAALREGCELTTKLVATELVRGQIVKVAEERTNAKGTERLKIIAAAPEEGSNNFEPLSAWGSKKLFTFKGFFFEESSSASSSSQEAKGVRPPSSVPTAMPREGEKYVVVGKAGAMLRAGCELDSADLELTLEAGTEVYVAETKTNKKGSLRARIGRYATASSWTWTAIDGWCTAKFLSSKGGDKKKKQVIMPLDGSPLLLFDEPTSKGHVFLFPGQGAQKVGMMAPYLEAPGVKAMFDLASSVFDGEDLLKIIQEGPAEKLNDTRFSQACVFLTSLAAVKKLQAEDPEAIAKADACAGFSLGEYTALAFAGVLDLKTAVKLLKLRGEAMGKACDSSDVPTGMMTVIGLDDQQLTDIMTPNVSIANQLFPKGRVLSGPKDELAKLETTIKDMKVDKSKTIVQPVSGAFHSKYMQPAADELKKALDAATFSKPIRTVYSNVTAKPHNPDDVNDVKANMCTQLTAGVLWEDTMRDMEKRFDDVAAFFEPAPGRQLQSMMKRIIPANQPKLKGI